MKRPLVAILVIVFLLICAAGSWTWYFATKAPDTPRRIVLRQGGPPLQGLAKPRKATAGERQGAIRSILAQLDAFRRDDYQTAAKYQSSSLRRNFGSTAAFQSVIEKSYPQFADYKSATFGDATAVVEGKTISVQVPIELIGQDGVKVEAMYVMVKESGIYRVSGVSGGFPENSPPDQDTPKVPGGFEDVAPLIT